MNERWVLEGQCTEDENKKGREQEINGRGSIDGKEGKREVLHLDAMALWTG